MEGLDFGAGGSTLIPALAVESPQGAEYLIPSRAVGAFADYLKAHPDSPRARLERYIVVQYPAGANLVAARNALLGDTAIEHVHVPTPAQFLASPGLSAVRALATSLPAQSSSDWHETVGTSELWGIAGGWALVGIADSGIATSHVQLAPFAGPNYVAGNFLPALSFDVGRIGLAGCQQAGNCIESNPDEAQPIAVAVGGNCDLDGDGMATPVFAGHGTHVAGLVAARGPVTSGACRDCGIVAWRVARDICVQAGELRPSLNPGPIDAAITIQADIGVQVINQSFGRSDITNAAHCQVNPLNSECLALAHAAARGVLLVAASGNNRGPISFPASHSTVVAVGGLGQGLALWNRDPDEPPNHLDQCPQPPIVSAAGRECGSNFTVTVGVDRRQEIVAPAEGVLSTTYPGFNWNVGLACGDGFGGPMGDGIGECTGTSMAAPIIAGIVGVLRSINPLVPPGDPENAVDAVGIRDVVTATTHAAQAGQAWSPKLGYGQPDPAAAARSLLGTARGQRVRNRAIPLFDFHSAGATDYAATASPQIAMTFAISQSASWAPRGQIISGYPSYPLPPSASIPAPHASAFVLSTEFRTRPEQPALVPLYLMTRARPWPLGCIPGTPGCNEVNRDYTLFSTTAAVQTAFSDGYALLGRQGYIFQRCAPEPSCQPAGSSKLIRQCNDSEDDCAIFLEHELPAFVAAGYNSAYPAGSDPVLGYAYRNLDSDGDALIDGFELLIGTNPNSVDSDGDGLDDGLEYPLAGVPLSDPCDGPAITCSVIAIFSDGFE